VYISRIEDRNGNVIATFTTRGTEVISEADAYVMTKMMKGVVDFGTGRALRRTFGISPEMAGKTGTTNDNADGWFIGFSPQLLAGVWVGADDPFLRLLYTTGGAQMAMPAYAYFFQQVYKDNTLNIDPQAKFVVPETIRNEAIYDYEALTGGEAPPPAEGEDVGTGSSSDFIDVPVSDGSEEVTTESRKPDEVTETPKPVKKDDKAEEKKEEKKEDRKDDTKTDKKPPAATDTAEKKKKFLDRVFKRRTDQ
jgi:penicillin-binding protein 1A